jgi:hypothetical protein
MKRKMFTTGQTVEVQRSPGASWEPATYGRESRDMSSRRNGHHWVELPITAKPRYLDPMSGEVHDKRDREGRRYLCRGLLVPSIQVRAVRGAKP